MVVRTYRQVVRVPTATTSFLPGMQIAPNGVLKHVSIAAGNDVQGPVFCNVRANIEGKDLFIDEGWVRGYSRSTGTGLAVVLDMETGFREQPSILLIVRNDTGSTQVLVIQAIVDGVS